MSKRPILLTIAQSLGDTVTLSFPSTKALRAALPENRRFIVDAFETLGSVQYSFHRTRYSVERERSKAAIAWAEKYDKATPEQRERMLARYV